MDDVRRYVRPLPNVRPPPRRPPSTERLTPYIGESGIKSETIIREPLARRGGFQHNRHKRVEHCHEYACPDRRCGCCGSRVSARHQCGRLASRLAWKLSPRGRERRRRRDRRRDCRPRGWGRRSPREATTRIITRLRRQFITGTRTAITRRHRQFITGIDRIARPKGRTDPTEFAARPATFVVQRATRQRGNSR